MKALVYSLNPLGWATCKWLKLFWPGCLLSSLNGLSLRELPQPNLSAGEAPGRLGRRLGNLDEWVRCRTLLGGICGSDLAVLMQRHPPDSFLQSFSSLPTVLGHENVAVVDQAGPAVDAGWVGKRVCVDPALCCRVRGIDPPCPPCRAGQFGACENFSADGQGTSALPPGSCLGYCGPVGGSWGEYFLAHVSQLIEVPEELTDEQAVLTDPLACGLHAACRADLSAAGKVLICGAGVLGQGVVWALRSLGYGGRIDIIARHRHQGELAGKLGASDVLFLPGGPRQRFEAIAERTGARLTRARFGNCMLSGGYDVVFECIGSRRSIEEALKWTRSRGQMVMVGTGHGRGADLTALWFGELTVLGSSGRAEEQFGGRKVHAYRLVHELMAAGEADVAALLTHTFSVDEYKAALTAAVRKAAHRSVKVAFRYPTENGSARRGRNPK